MAANPSALRGSLTAALILGFSAPLLAATPADAATVSGAPSTTSPIATAQPAQKCMADLRTLDGQMQTDGYWLHGSGYGYGYPMYGYGQRETMGAGSLAAIGHRRARPGYEVRTLIASANILGNNGKQEACDVVLAAARDIYKGYAAELRDGKESRIDWSTWTRQQIAAALPVTGSKTAYRADQLIGADVVNGQGVDLGDVYDVVMNPQNGKIAYLVIGRGGVFGVGEKHVPVPWEAFKVSAGGNLVVLDTTKANMDAAPRVAVDHFSPHGSVGQQGQSADAFWKTSLLK
jgi:sporulation protein YlmC with PRC-barrel domain